MPEEAVLPGPIFRLNAPWTEQSADEGFTWDEYFISREAIAVLDMKNLAKVRYQIA